MSNFDASFGGRNGPAQSWRSRDWDAWWRERFLDFPAEQKWNSYLRPLEAMGRCANAQSYRDRQVRRILCLGNGVSQEPRALAHAGFEVIGLDISQTATDFAASFQLSNTELRMFFQWDELGYEGVFERQARPGGSCRFVRGDAFDSRVAQGPFDAIFSWRTLQGFDDHEVDEILRAMDARLSAAGLLFITGQNAARSTVRISDALAEMGYGVNPQAERMDAKTAWVLVASG